MSSVGSRQTTFNSVISYEKSSARLLACPAEPRPRTSPPHSETQENKMSQQLTRVFFAFLSLTLAVTASFAQNNLTAKANNLQPTTPVAEETDRARDGLIGPVRRVRTEVAKLMTVSGKVVEDNKRVLLE